MKLKQKVKVKSCDAVFDTPWAVQPVDVSFWILLFFDRLEVLHGEDLCSDGDDVGFLSVLKESEEQQR